MTHEQALGIMATIEHVAIAINHLGMALSFMIGLLTVVILLRSRR